jgi:DNA-binding GntR family transcriptional regulator
LLEPSLRAMIDRVPQARARIVTAQKRLCEALSAGDAEAAHAWMARHIRDFRRGYELAGIELQHRIVGDAPRVV